MAIPMGQDESAQKLDVMPLTIEMMTPGIMRRYLTYPEIMGFKHALKSSTTGELCNGLIALQFRVEPATTEAGFKS
jgi:hypothetical protein